MGNDDIFLKISQPVLIGELTNRWLPIVINELFKLDLLFLKITSYGQSTLQFKANTFDKTTWPCQFTVIGCHILCKECHLVNIATKNNHQCTICIDGYEFNIAKTKCEPICTDYWFIDASNKVQCDPNCFVRSLNTLSNLNVLLLGRLIHRFTNQML